MPDVYCILHGEYLPESFCLHYNRAACIIKQSLQGKVSNLRRGDMPRPKKANRDEMATVKIENAFWALLET
ncbi:MAG: hypothetical protein J6T16_07835, partial [Opitutales bacterium]|nr:hypothetical protein [Opitutales bacterium]